MQPVTLYTAVQSSVRPGWAGVPVRGRVTVKNTVESFKSEDSGGPTALAFNFDEEPILAGSNWEDSNNDVVGFNDSDDEDDDDDEEEEEQKRTKSSNVIGFDQDF